MGDPETEVVMPRLKNDLVDLFVKTWEGTLSTVAPISDHRPAVTVVLVSGGYPGDYKKGIPVYNLSQVDGSLLFHSGTDTER
jgi:phosphoribosylamine---glycine ligase